MTDTVLSPQEAANVARRALPLLDLTDLSDGCTREAVEALCRDARADGVAAVCVWPRFVGQAAAALAGGPVRIATVVNFPAGGEDIAGTVRETHEALAAGTDEIDLVLPYRALLRGDAALCREMVTAVREVCADKACLKVILETGILCDPEVIASAGTLALDAGANFIKTSTGKTEVSATPEAAAAMLHAVHAHHGDRRAGLKVSGGLRRVGDAACYLRLADEIMGPDWASPATFRIGASSLRTDLVRALEADR